MRICSFKPRQSSTKTVNCSYCRHHSLHIIIIIITAIKLIIIITIIIIIYEDIMSWESTQTDRQRTQYGAERARLPQRRWFRRLTSRRQADDAVGPAISRRQRTVLLLLSSCRRRHQRRRHPGRQPSTAWGCPLAAAWSECCPCTTLRSACPARQWHHQMPAWQAGRLFPRHS